VCIHQIVGQLRIPYAIRGACCMCSVMLLLSTDDGVFCCAALGVLKCKLKPCSMLQP
jgi:hypothetical protein